MIGFLLCGHGSRDPLSVAGFAEIAAGLAPLLAERPFAYGFMELADPDLGTALGSLVAAGATRDAVDTEMSQHVLAEGVLVGTFAH